MQNIFSEEDYNDIVKRIENLQETQTRQWGFMDVVQMFKHCSLQLKLALGKILSTEAEGPALYRTGFVKWLVIFVIPWSKGLPTPGKMNLGKINVDTNSFTIEKKQLLSLLEEVKLQNEFLPHPFLGNMNKRYWGRIMWKHLNHHLRQFNG